MNLEFTHGDFDEAAILLDELLARVRYGDNQGGASKLFAKGPPQSDQADNASDAGQASDDTQSPTAGSPSPQETPQPQSDLQEAPAQSAFDPVGEIQIESVDNKGAVRNGPTNPVVVNPPEPIFILSIQTYHWNDGRGQLPGTFALRAASGEVFGPWSAVGMPGQGGVPDAYWRVEPGLILPAGKYELVDSSPETWATNDAADTEDSTRPVESVVQPPEATPGTATPGPIFERWNNAPCETTDTATFTIDGSVHLDSIELLYHWDPGESSTGYTVAFNGEKIGNGTLERGSCDQEREDWCIARAETAADLVPGLYVIQTQSKKICQNAASGGTGFIRAFGSQR